MRRVCISLLALGVVAGAPWAVTHAIFSDTASAGSNTFTTGTVDLSLSPATAVVGYANMAPGDATTASLVVTDGGTLELRYAISASATNPDGLGLKDQLALTIKTIDVTTPGSPCSDFDGTQLYAGDLDGTTGALVGASTQGADPGDRVLAASGSETLCFRVSLPPTTGDAYQGASTTASFTFDAEQTAGN